MGSLSDLRDAAEALELAPARGRRTKTVTEDLFNRLRKHYENGWYFATQVPAAHIEGERGTRLTDGVAVSAWSSLSYEIQGVEVKATRGDWLVELSDPAKSEASIRYCDRWYVCAPKGVVREAELPKGWGLFIPGGSGLAERVKAERREHEEPPRYWWTLLFRRIAQRDDPDDLARAKRESYAAGEKRGRDERRWELDHLKRERDRLNESVAKFEKASGIEIGDYNGEELGKAVRVVLEREGFVRMTAHQFQNIERLSRDLRAALEAAGWATLPES